MNVLVLPFCIGVPFTDSLELEDVGIGDLLTVGDVRPHGAMVSAILPAAHWLVMIWKSRALTSLTIV